MWLFMRVCICVRVGERVSEGVRISADGMGVDGLGLGTRSEKESPDGFRQSWNFVIVYVVREQNAF